VTATGPEGDDESLVDITPGADLEGTPRTKLFLKVGVRITIVVLALSLAVFALANIFGDLDVDQIRDALNRLEDAEWLALGFGWLAWIGAQGLQTASLVDKLPARRGVLAYLGPSAVASVIPGPSDLPVRYSMYQSWGVSSREAATAVAASGIFSVGSQLALPALAGIFIVFGDVKVEGFGALIVIATLILAVAIVVFAFALGSPRRTKRLGELLDPVMRLGYRMIRREPPEENFGQTLVTQRNLAFDHLRGKWLSATGATILTVATKCALLIMALRFVGIPEGDLGWSAIFVVFALVAGLTVIPITPGSVGVTEVALVGLLTPLAGTEFVNEIAAGVLLYRLLTWLLIIPVGFGVLGVWRINTRQKDDADAESAEPTPVAE
jgi:uncharacterized membrane protein YbhN (UPF0104 family)